MKINLKSRKARHGTVSVALTAVTVAAVVILNIIMAVLAARFDWFYINMSGSRSYALTQDCKDYLEKYVISEMDADEDITFIFCDEKDNVEAELTQSYIHDSALEIMDMFPDRINIEYLNIYEQPSQARKYGVDAPTSVVVKYGESYVTLRLRDFYIFAANDSATPLAYNGERRLATGMMRAVQPETPLCYITVNHGELFDDYELMYMLADAGYNYTYIDLLNSDIPEDCDLLLTFDPKQDLAGSDEVSAVSEGDKIREYMNNGGKYMVFVDADTFVSGGHENFESLLSEWGVEFLHSTGEDGIENCYNIKDPSHSTSTDGYTILAEKALSGKGAEMLSDIERVNRFGNSTCIGASEGFSPDGNGNFTADVDGRVRTFSPLLVSHSSAEAWAGGRVVAKATETPFTLMSLTEQTCENGESSYLVACASTEFASEDAMQSTVFGNHSTLSTLLKYMGKENVATTLDFKPFGRTPIESVTTVQSATITAALVVIPALAVTLIGIILLVRRRYR